MKEELVRLLVCPSCSSELEMKVFKRDKQIMDGLFTCRCGEWYPIINGIPRMLTAQLKGDYSDFLSKYKTKMPIKIIKDAKSIQLKKKTSTSFGLEWKRYKDYGWLGRGNKGKIDITQFKSVDQEDLWSHTEETFWRKALLKKKEVKNKLVLDVGVGNGRYAQVCTDAGAKVIGIDLSQAVDVAYENTKGHVDTVQCDLFDLPFRKNSFDVVYSIGVLHHTPSTKKAFQSISKHAKKNGIVAIHLYHKGNFIYEIVDYTIRLVTTRLPLRLLWYLCYIPTFLGRTAFLSKYIYTGINSLIVLRSGHHFNFDWYSAPVAFHHTETEVVKWYRDMDFKKIEGDDPTNNKDSYYAKIYPKFLKNHNGTVKKWVANIVPRWGLTVRGIK